MAELSKTSARLRFLGDDLVPNHISSILGAEPTEGRMKGGIWHAPVGHAMIARTGSWVRSVECRQPGDLDAQIAELLQPLSGDMEAWQTLSHRFNGNIFCGLLMLEYNEGISLQPESLMMLAKRGLLIDFDIYHNRWQYDAQADEFINIVLWQSI